MIGEDIRGDAWNLLYATKVNVCYWKSMIGLYDKRARRVKYCVAGIGLIAAVAVGIASREWVRSVVTAISSFLISVVGVPRVLNWTASDSKRGHERWSQLCSDAEILWRHGEVRGWKDSDIMARTAGLLEREKQYQAYEFHSPNRSMLDTCEALVRSELTSVYCSGNN